MSFKLQTNNKQSVVCEVFESLLPPFGLVPTPAPFVMPDAPDGIGGVARPSC